MGDVVPFKKIKPARKSNTLCLQGHHKWILDKKKQFDVKQGKLVTVYHCKYCGKTKVKAD